MTKMTTTVEVELELEIEYTMDPPDTSVGIMGWTLADTNITELRVVGHGSWHKVPPLLATDLYSALEGVLDEAVTDHFNNEEE